MIKYYLLRLTLIVVLATAAWAILAADLALPPGILITSKSKTHVHADISALRIEDFPALAKIQALYAVYISGDGATDEKLKALSKLHFTNLVSVVCTDCPF